MSDSQNRADLVLPSVEEVDYETVSQEESPSAPKVGRWFWVKDADKKPWLGCVVHLGSNYVSLEGVEYHKRIHTDEFEESCSFESNADHVIQSNIDQHQTKVRLLLAQVKEVTARLSITTGPALPAGNDVKALAVHKGEAVNEYKKALVLAKERTLPDLFKDIEKANKGLETWLGASLIPLKAQVGSIQPAIRAIEDRIFSVQLYAGLVEEVEKIQDGAPAATGEKIRLFQRRCYMDEESLARYEVGGMEFKDIPSFDRWLLRPDNLRRLLPFDRCIVAFRVRRNAKEREGFTISDFIRMSNLAALDNVTFLYIRNGEQVYRLNTAIEFGEKLFPDMDHNQLTGKLYAEMYGSHVQNIIPESRYLGMLEDEARREREIEEAKAAAEKLPKDKRPWFPDYVHRESRRYQAYNKDNVYYDDISASIQRMISEHNRLVLVLQGLLDRSPVFQPHPQWSLWTAGGFGQALELLFDDSRALTTGAKPDFEAYRAKLNANLKPGCVTVGQRVAWEESEAEKERERRHGDWSPSRYRPYGNPGPDTLAYTVRVGARNKACTFEWTRERSTSAPRGASNEIKVSFVCPAEKLLNVSAYKPGDFKQFFEDPRTRAEYLQWAYLLLEAEEFHAGNRELDPPKVMPKRVRTAEGAAEYRARKWRKSFVGKAVRLIEDVQMKSGKVYEEGTLWRVTCVEGKKFTVAGIEENGQWSIVKTNEAFGSRRIIRGLDSLDFEVDESVPAEADRAAQPEEEADAAEECSETDSDSAEEDLDDPDE